MTVESDALQAISRARANLCIRQPFFATLALRLEVVMGGVPTMGTDGKMLAINPAWVLEQKPDELVTIVAHESLHCALQHPYRRQGRDPVRANISMDYAINPLLKDAGFPMPKSALLDPKFAGMAWEEIYPHIKVTPVPMPGNYGGMGECLDAPNGLSASEQTQLEQEWKIAVIQAAATAKAQGKLPASLEALIDAVRAPQVDWRAMLREFIRAASRNDFSWRRPNSRFLATGDYLPSLYDETMGPIVMVTDTSGSVSQEELNAICSELNGCLDTARPEAVHCVYVDAQVHGHETFAPDDWPVKMRVKGRGGTCLAPAWPYLREQDIHPVVGIVATDLELCVADLGAEPDFPVLVLSTAGRAAPLDGPLPFGTLVKVSAAV